MKELLFLCHRMPYPPDKGDKIRSFNLLKALAARYRVHLGTFVDEPADWQYREVVDTYCDQQCYRPLPARRARLRSLMGLLRNQALTLACYRDRPMARWVARLMHERPISAIVVFSSGMAPYALDYPATRRILDFVDVDSEKWRQYAAGHRGAGRWLYAREAKHLLAAERLFAACFDASVFVSEAEADLFRRRAPERANRISAIGNGVDSDYFDPARQYTDPHDGAGAQQIVFTGVMDYGANIDAVTWFAEEVLPLIRERQPKAEFVIVGTRPTRRVRDLERLPGIRVTGAVADVRPYLARARLAVAPMRIARGLQNKVLEALAMGTPVVLTPQAATGLVEVDDSFSGLASQPDALAAQTLRFLGNSESNAATAGAAARAYVLAYYAWSRQLDDFMRLIAGDEDALAGPEPTPAAEQALA